MLLLIDPLVHFVSVSAISFVPVACILIQTFNPNFNRAGVGVQSFHTRQRADGWLQITHTFGCQFLYRHAFLEINQ